MEPSCYCLKTRRACAAVTKFYDTMLAPSGVTVRQYSLLLNISQAHSCSVRELADLAELDRSTLARSLKPLYAQGFIVNAKQPSARNSQLELTNAGKETVEQAKELWSKAQEAVSESFGSEGIVLLEELLQRLKAL